MSTRNKNKEKVNVELNPKKFMSNNKKVGSLSWYDKLSLYAAILGLIISQLNPRVAKVKPVNIVESYQRAADKVFPQSVLNLLGRPKTESSWITVLQQMHDYKNFGVIGIKWIEQIYAIATTGVDIGPWPFQMISKGLIVSTVGTAKRGYTFLKSKKTLDEAGRITLDILHLFLVGFSLIAMYEAEEAMNKGPRTQLAVGLTVPTLEFFIPYFIMMCNSLFDRMLSLFKSKQYGLPRLMINLRNVKGNNQGRNAQKPHIRGSKSNLRNNRNNTPPIGTYSPPLRRSTRGQSDKQTLFVVN